MSDIAPTTQGNAVLLSLKSNSYYQIPLYEMYYYTIKCSHLNDEELKEYFCSQFIPFIHKLPKVSSTLTYKGNLRISWAFDMNYNKNIDLIFFPEENPYINYVCLYAKDFPKTIAKDNLSRIDRELEEIYPPYNINYDFVKEILAKSGLSVAQQERFFQVRFGSVFVPMEIEFEWYVVNWNYLEIEKSTVKQTILFPKYDKYLNGILEGGESLTICLGIIKSYKVLSKDTNLNFPILQFPSDYKEWMNNIFYSVSDLFTPLPISALATTQTNINDFIVNLRDKPNTKEGKIVAQLFSQEFSSALLLPKYQKLQEENGWGGETTFIVMYKEMQEYDKAQHSYYKKEKPKLINPLWGDEYLILVWNIESNNWAKVWVLRYIEEFISHSYIDTFNNSPSKLKLYEGYIHCSGLTYLMPFSENYIKR